MLSGLLVNFSFSHNLSLCVTAVTKYPLAHCLRFREVKTCNITQCWQNAVQSLLTGLAKALALRAFAQAKSDNKNSRNVIPLLVK
jgi:hypothetical protein